MSGIQPVAFYAMKVPPGDIMVPAVPEFAAMFRLTMAAIDPSAEPELESADDKQPARSTLKVIRIPDHLFDSDDDSEDDDFSDDSEEDSEESEDDEEVNGGPSTRKSKKQALLEALAQDEQDDEDMADNDEDDDKDDAEAIATLEKLLKSSKGKGKAVDGEELSDDDEDSDEEAIEMDEVVVCTLDPAQHYQQTLDFVVAEGEKVFFKVSGTHTVHLTGNYVIPQDDAAGPDYDEDDYSDDEEEEDYDLSPYEEDEEDELDHDILNALAEESDDLDDLADPRVTEVDSDEETAPKLVKAAKGKGKNKRPAEDSADEEGDEDDLDAIMAKSLKKSDDAAAPAATNGETKKLSKAEKKKLKKLKNNDGEAAAAPVKKEPASSANSSEKKVQFAKNLEQGPTPSGSTPTPASKPEKEKAKDKPTANTTSTSLGTKEVQGVSVDDRKLGSGPAAKKGSRIEMRYIGKLESGKVFDSNKSGKPFGFKLGAGEVIKGWDIGVAGIQVGGERRLTIPAHLAYGSKALPGIPKNSKLIFDIKCLGIK